MSIRTPSVGTKRRAISDPANGQASRLIVVALVCCLLAGCSSGVARDARSDEARDAGLGRRLAEEQATFTVQRFFPATATPEATKAPTPFLRNLAITFGFRPDGTPDGSYASVPAGIGGAYAAAELADVSVGQKIRAVVTDAWGNEIARPEVTIDAGAADRWVAFPIPLPAELAPGAYGVFIQAGGRQIGSLEFGVTGVGSSAQLLPEAPANPQAKSTIPPPGMSSVAQETPTVAPSN